MATNSSPAVERRIAPRFAANFDAELASGTVLVPVQVRDLSISGCGIQILSEDPDLPDKLGARGLLHLPATDPGTFGTILSVNLRNVRRDGYQIIYGLEFTTLLSHQARKLHAILAHIGQTEAGPGGPDIQEQPADAVASRSFCLVKPSAPSSEESPSRRTM